MIDILEILSNAINKGVCLTLIRDPNSIEKVIKENKGDIDLYLKYEHVDKFIDFMKSFGFLYNAKSTTFSHTKSKIVVDIHYGLYKRLPFMTEDLFFQGNRKYLNIPILSQKHLFIIILLHPLDITGIRGGRSYSKEKLDFLKNHNYLFQDEYVKRTICSWLGRLTYKFILNTDVKLFKPRLYVIKISSFLFGKKVFYFFVKRVIEKISRFFNGGSVVCVTGVDGSGKTTLINSTLEYLDSRGMDGGTKVHYMGLLGGYKLPFLKIYYKLRKKKEANEHHKRKNASLKIKSQVKKYLLIIFVCMDFIIRILDMYIDLYLYKKNIIADRYIYDLSKNGKVSYGLINFLTWFFPKPQLVIFLHVDADISFNRKKEYSPRELDIHQNNLEKYLISNINNAQKVNASQGETEVFEHAISMIYPKL